MCVCARGLIGWMESGSRKWRSLQLVHWAVCGIPEPVSMLNKLDRDTSFATSAGNFQNSLAVSSRESRKLNGVTVTLGNVRDNEEDRLTLKILLNKFWNNLFFFFLLKFVPLSAEFRINWKYLREQFQRKSWKKKNVRKSNSNMAKRFCSSLLLIFHNPLLIQSASFDFWILIKLCAFLTLIKFSVILQPLLSVEFLSLKSPHNFKERLCLWSRKAPRLKLGFITLSSCFVCSFFPSSLWLLPFFSFLFCSPPAASVTDQPDRLTCLPKLLRCVSISSATVHVPNLRSSLLSDPASSTWAHVKCCHGHWDSWTRFDLARKILVFCVWCLISRLTDLCDTLLAPPLTAFHLMAL